MLRPSALTLARYVDGDLPPAELRRIGGLAAEDDELQARIELLEYLAGDNQADPAPPSVPSADVSESEIRDAVNQELEEVTEDLDCPYSKVVDAAFRRACYGRGLEREQILRVFRIAGDQIRRSICEIAGSCFDQDLEPPTAGGHSDGMDASDAAQITAHAGAASVTTLGDSKRHPQRALDQVHAVDKFRDICRQHADIYCLAVYAGRSAVEIGELLELPESEVTEILNSAHAEIAELA